MSIAQVEEIKKVIEKARDTATILRGERYLTKWGRCHLDEALGWLNRAETLLRRLADDVAQDEIIEHNEEQAVSEDMPAWW
jgi:hypothetical protein